MTRYFGRCEFVSLGAVVQVAAVAGPTSYGHVTRLLWIPTRHLKKKMQVKNTKTYFSGL